MQLNCADFATVVTGRLMVSVERLYEIYNALTGDNLYTHQLPGAAHFCEPFVCGTYPEQAKAMQNEKDRVSADTWLDVLADWKTRFGDRFTVEVPLAGWVHRDPLTELVEMVGSERVLAETSEK